MAAPALDEEIQSVSYYNVRPLIFHAYIGPFLLIYGIWLYCWVAIYGLDDYCEAGLIVLAILGLLQILTSLFCMWSVTVRCLLSCANVRDPYKASWVKVVPTPNNRYSTEFVQLEHVQGTSAEELCFYFQKAKYIYDHEKKKQFVAVTFPTQQTMRQYLDWKGYQEDAEVTEAETKFGKNLMEMDIPQLLWVFKERATAPFFVFQVVFCVGLSCLVYPSYAIALMFIIPWQALLVEQQFRHMTEMSKMGNKPYPIQVYRNRKWRPILSSELVPGDVVSIGRSQDDKLVPCDMLLLRGTCIVDESMFERFTGESEPVMKEPVENVDLDHVLNMERDGKLHVLYGGTKVVQHTPPSKSGPGLKASDNGSIAYVLRHSFNTCQGQLLLAILYEVKRGRGTENNIFNMDYDTLAMPGLPI